MQNKCSKFLALCSALEQHIQSVTLIQTFTNNEYHPAAQKKFNKIIEKTAKKKTKINI